MVTAKRQHQMPFGTEVLENGKVCFRVWAPSASRMDVCIMSDSDSSSDTVQAILPMLADNNGWYSLATDMASTGTRYTFRVDNNMQVPDPASRFQPHDVHGPSEVIDPADWVWNDGDWSGRPWEESIIYELHTGCFTSEGTFVAMLDKLDYLVETGITAIELMPVADFPGDHNWGYDGTYLFAPDSRYGRPEELKALVDAAHGRGLMVFLDVVYNHFGPEGNYLNVYASSFFTSRHMTPWGAAINYDDENSYWVRQFFIHNALYWLEEYHLDGLRFDAVHAIADDLSPDILTELAWRVHGYFDNNRHVHLILENDNNTAHYLAQDNSRQPCRYVAQWNDDFHHALHVLLTDEEDGYYMDYADDPARHLGRCLAEGFAYQGEESPFRNNLNRGEISSQLPATAFVSFLQNHDQVGNRAFGERLSTLSDTEQRHAAVALLMLAPSPPLLFMGEEWGCEQPFLFFCDFSEELAKTVTAGRRDEFRHFTGFTDTTIRHTIPDPMAAETFRTSVLDWTLCQQSEHQGWLALYRKLIKLRHSAIIPRLPNISGRPSSYMQLARRALSVNWTLGDSSELTVFVNMGQESVSIKKPSLSQILYMTHPGALDELMNGHLLPWSVSWSLEQHGWQV